MVVSILQAAGRHHVDRHAEERLQSLLEVHEVEQRAALVELDEEVDVARLRLFPTSHRPEQGNGVGAMLPDEVIDLITTVLDELAKLAHVENASGGANSPDIALLVERWPLTAVRLLLNSLREMLSLRRMGLVPVMSVVAWCSGCSSDAAPPPLAHPALQCDGGRSGTVNPDFDPDIPGAPDKDELAKSAVVGASEKVGRVALLAPGVAALSVDNRTVIVVEVTAAPAGGFWVNADLRLRRIPERRILSRHLVARLSRSAADLLQVAPSPARL